ncbi:MAG: PilZ domain-containing protein [bacterium]|nr:PilZ domain-containing protein [bacterium]
MSDPATADARALVAEWLEAAKACGEADSYPGKRRHVRWVWDQPLQIQTAEGVHYVRSRDVSETGIGLVCRLDLPSRMAVRIRRDESEPWVRARVTHSTQTVGAFKTGVDLTFEF